MEYQVPQFIEVEDKIVGPLTLRQFIYIAGGAGLCVICYLYLPLYIAFPFMALIAGGTAALAFYRLNGKPMIEIVEAAFNYLIGAKLFLWRHRAETRAAGKPIAIKPQAPVPAAPALSRGKLAELAWSLDVKQPGAGDELES